MWRTPKIDWEIKPKVNGLYNGDWFNVDPDYIRITDNLRYLRIVGQNVYGVTLPSVTMIEQTLDYYPNADVLNAIESNLLSIIQGSYYPAAYTGKKTWLDNGPTPTVDDLNRIERSCAELLAKYNETPLDVFIPNGSDALITSGGDNFMVRRAI